MKKIILVVLLGVLSGCEKSEIQTYALPKEIEYPVNNLEIKEKQNHLPFDAIIPSNWIELPGQGMRKVTYAIEGTSIDFYAIVLGMGDVTSNVNRWRGQIGLPDAASEVIDKQTKLLSASGIEVKFYELYNDNNGQGILAAIIDVSSSYWFFTAKGTIVELKTHSSDIQRFINSIKFY